MVIQREAEVWVNLGVPIIGRIKEIRSEDWILLETFRGEIILCKRGDLRDIRELYHV